MSIYRIVRETPGLRAPVLISSFDSWIDAGGAATGATAHITQDAETVATFDTDALLDYRARRPILDVVNGETKHLTWQEITVKLVRTHARDLLVLSGPEPDYRWKEFSASVLEFALHVGIVESVGLGALPAAVPHTRAVPLIATATPPDLLGPDDRRPEGLLRVPAAALSVVQMRFIEHGIPAVGFFAQVPHYVTPVYADAVVALVQRLAAHLGIDVALGGLPDEARRQRMQLDAIIEARPDVKEHIERLESLALEGGLTTGGRIPSGDEIAAEVEKFLRRTRGDSE